MRSAFFIALLALSLTACASAPSRITDACAIFAQRDGLFNNWARDAKAAEREYGVPVPILMATIYVESGFRAKARPPRTYLLGFIPWKRVSTAYGYAQALDGTWATYKRETGRWNASRSDFGDAIHLGLYVDEGELGLCGDCIADDCRKDEKPLLLQSPDAIANSAFCNTQCGSEGAVGDACIYGE